MLLKSPAEGIVVAAVSSGREQVWQQVFKVESSCEIIAEILPSSFRLKNLIANIENIDVSILLLEGDLFEKARQTIPDFDTGKFRCIKIDEPLSRFIGLKGIQSSVHEEVFPICYRDEREN